MSRVKQLALDVDVEFTAGSPFSITFTADTAVVFTSPSVTLKTKGGDVVSGTAVPAAGASGDELTCSWSTTASAAANTNTNTRALQYRFEVQALVNGVGPFPIYGGDVVVWPKGVATGGSSTTSVTGSVNVGGVAITGTVNLSGSGVSSGQTLSHDRKDLYSITNQHNLSRLVCGIDDETSVVWGYNSSGVYQASGLTTGTTLITTPWGATRTLPTNVTPNPNGARMLRWNDKVFLVCWNSSTSVMEVYSADPQSGSSPTWTWSSLLHSLAANARVIGTCVSGGASGLFIAEYSGSSDISGGPSLYRTTDGTTFETVLGPLADTRHFHAVAEDPYNPGHIYVTAGDSSASPAWVWKSTDGGDTWDEVETLNEVYWQAVKIDFDEDWVYFWSDQYQSGGNVYICDRETMTPQWFTPHRVDRIAVPGATNARVLTDCAHATSDATLTSSSGAFTSRDRGRLIGGTAFFALGTYVQSVTSSTEVELSAGALGGGSLTNRTVAMLGDTFFAAGYHGGIDPDTGYVYCVANDTSSAGTTGGLFVCTRRGEPWQLLNTFYIPVAGEVDSAMYIKDGWAFIGAYGPIRLLTV